MLLAEAWTLTLLLGISSSLFLSPQRLSCGLDDHTHDKTVQNSVLVIGLAVATGWTNKPARIPLLNLHWPSHPHLCVCCGDSPAARQQAGPQAVALSSHAETAAARQPSSSSSRRGHVLVLGCAQL